MSLLVYRSSAGSGKTFTLVREYLKIVLKEPLLFRSVLAITFTNKSANEMKERIILYLTQLADPGHHQDSIAVRHMLPDLQSGTGLSQDAVVQRAGEVLALILHHYSDFAIMTIDSFVYRIIRTFAHDMHLPHDFDVELDTESMIRKAIDLLLSQAGNNAALTRVLVNFIESKANDEENWQIEGDLQRFAETMLKEEAMTYLEKIKDLTLEDFFGISRTLAEHIKKFENTLYAIATEALALVDERGIRRAAFYYPNQGLMKYFEYLADRRYDKLIPNTRVLDTVDNNKWYGSAATTAEQLAIDGVKAPLTDAFNRIRVIAEKQYPHYALFALLYGNIYPIALLNEIGKVMAELKSRNRFIHISDFNRHIAAAIVNEPVPFIYERLGDRFHHFLIDEFQDTSVLQWHNLLPLIHNSLAFGSFNMLVGDGKQAIYRWRNGEVEQFAMLPRIFRKEDNPALDEVEKSLTQHHKEHHLETNYRSKAGIVDFNNDFFEEISTLLSGTTEKIYEHLRQTRTGDRTGGFVHLEFYDNRLTDESPGDYNCRRVKEIIGELEDDGFHRSDIAILCRTNENASELARFLLGENIDVISYESLLLKNSPDVRFIIAFITYLLQPTAIGGMDIVNYLRVNNLVFDLDMRSYLVRDEQESTDRIYDPGRLYRFLNDNGFSVSVTALLKFPVYDLNEEVIRLFHINRDINPYLQFYLDAVLKYAVSVSSGIAEFLDWWEEKKDNLSILIPEGSEAVRIMTIHKSKGLEFPVVIYPYANEKLRITRRHLWVELEEEKLPALKAALLPVNAQMKETVFAPLYEEEHDKSMLDLVNILYVAMTRPVDRLYVISSRPGEDFKETRSVPQLLCHYLRARGLWTEDRNIYTFGDKIAYKPDKERKKKESFVLKHPVSNAWTRRIILSAGAPEVWDVEDPDRNRRWGNLIHAVLARITSEDDIGEVIAGFENSGVIAPEQEEELTAVITDLIRLPALRPYFKAGITVRTESEILLPDGQSYRPDRVVINGKEAVVMDYKTGKPDEKHQAQLRNYGKIMEQMGYGPVKMLLLYIDQAEKIVEVTP